MAGTYWLTILPDASKLEKGIKDAVKKAGQDISRGSTSGTGVGPEIILGDEHRWRDRARAMGQRIRDEIHNSGAGDVLHDVLVNAADEAAHQVGQRIGDAISGSPVGDALRDWRG